MCLPGDGGERRLRLEGEARLTTVVGDLVDGRADLVVALDVKTGKVAWDQALTSEKGLRLTGGPLVAKGKVMIGTVGRTAGGNYIVALDAETSQTGSE